MTIQHHLDDNTIMRLAAGELDEAFSLVCAAHISNCSQCRKKLEHAEKFGGALLDQAESAELPDEMFANLLQKVEKADPAQSGPLAAANTQKNFHSNDYDVPRPLSRYIGNQLNDVKWRWLSPGIKRHIIKKTKEYSLYLLKIAPGKTMPEHGHGGGEMTLILSGAYRDNMGVFQKGDVADLDEHVEHSPLVIGNEDCICLIAAQTPTRFKSGLGRILQPFLGV